MRLTSLFLILLASATAGADTKFDPPTQPGQCYGDVFSKVYLDKMSTPDTTYFMCNYNCFDNEGKKHIVKAVGSANALLAVSDGSVMVCDGARVVPKSINGHRIWDFAGVDPFWAATSSRPEIKSWARTNQIRIAPEALKAMEEKFYESVLAVGRAFYVAGHQSPVFREASLDLLEIGARTEKGKVLLENVLKEISKTTSTGAADFSARGMVLNVIAVHGRFLVP